jgi:hypothetical protein
MAVQTLLRWDTTHSICKLRKSHVTYCIVNSTYGNLSKVAWSLWLPMYSRLHNLTLPLASIIATELGGLPCVCAFPVPPTAASCCFRRHGSRHELSSTRRHGVWFYFYPHVCAELMNQVRTKDLRM